MSSSSVSVVCLGIAVLDDVQYVEEPPRWGVKSVSVAAELAAGGPATNAAITAARLLGSATLVTALGTGPAADLVQAELAGLGVAVVDIAPPGWRLPVAACVVHADGERTVVSPGAQTSAAVLTAAARAALADADVLLLDGHHPQAAAEALAERAASCLAVLDAGSAKPHAEAWLPSLDVLAGSADYARGLGLSPEQAIRHALDAGARSACVTDGPGEVLWATRAEPTPRRFPPPTVRAVDTLGAGDAFHGALAAALARGRDLGGAIELAVRVASTRVATRGARAWLAGVPPLR